MERKELEFLPAGSVFCSAGKFKEKYTFLALLGHACHMHRGSDSSSSHAGGNRGLGGSRQDWAGCTMLRTEIVLPKQTGLERESKCLLTPYGKINVQMA